MSESQQTLVSPTVFIVDDDPAVLTALSRLLRSYDYAVQTYASARALLEQDTAAVMGCLVLDVTMPDLNGFELQQTLIAVQQDRPIVFISGTSDIPISVRAMKTGAVDFLTKPINDEDLLTAVRAAVDKDHRGALLRRIAVVPRPIRHPYTAGTRSSAESRRGSPQQTDRRRSGHR